MCPSLGGLAGASQDLGWELQAGGLPVGICSLYSWAKFSATPPCSVCKELPSCPSNCGKNSAFSPRSRTSWINPQLPSHPSWVLGWGVWPQCAPCHWWCWFGTAWSVLVSCIERTACGEQPPHWRLDQHHPSSTSLCILLSRYTSPRQPLQEAGSCEAPASEGSSVGVGRARAVMEGLASALPLRPGAGI